MSKTDSSVGTSAGHTPHKHAFQNALQGRYVGALSNASMRHVNRNGLLFVELTAGDGDVSGKPFPEDKQYRALRAAWPEGTSSPALTTHHTVWLQNSRPFVPVNGILIEKHLQTFDTLSAQPYLESVDNLTLLHQDARDPFNIPSHGAAFVINDPNTVNQWAFTAEHADWFDDVFTTVYSTLGCNVGGLKRLSWDERQGWYGNLNNQMEMCHRSQDVLLVAIDKDAAQWAYAVTSPLKWRRETEAVVARTFAGRSVTTAWMKEQTLTFQALTHQLFMQKKERT